MIHTCMDREESLSGRVSDKNHLIQQGERRIVAGLASFISSFHLFINVLCNSAMFFN